MVSDRRSAHRFKDARLCRQAYEAITFAIADLCDEIWDDVVVLEVEAPDASHLWVIVGVSTEAAIEPVEAALEKIAGRLRSEVAAAIARKRAPLLGFRVVPKPEDVMGLDARD